MLLAIDCGNTNTVFAVWDGAAVLGSWRMATNPARTADEYAVWLTELMALESLKRSDIDDVILATVVPDVLFNLKTLCRKYFSAEPMIVGAPGVELGIEIRVQGRVGADRLVNSVACRDAYSGAVIVVDFGTATTFDVVDADGGYAGGVIAPGINLSLQALYSAAAQLPKIIIEAPPKRVGNEPEKVIGKNTVDAMHAGIFWGYIGLIEGLVTRIKAEYGAPMTVVATGGLAPLFADATPLIEHVDPDITMRGLVLIYQRNRKA